MLLKLIADAETNDDDESYVSCTLASAPAVNDDDKSVKVPLQLFWCDKNHSAKKKVITTHLFTFRHEPKHCSFRLARTHAPIHPRTTVKRQQQRSSRRRTEGNAGRKNKFLTAKIHLIQAAPDWIWTFSTKYHLILLHFNKISPQTSRIRRFISHFNQTRARSSVRRESEILSVRCWEIKQSGGTLKEVSGHNVTLAKSFSKWVLSTD